jgi:hypothetical protein
LAIRETFAPIREPRFRSPFQGDWGNYPSYQGNSFRPILEGFEGSKMPFLAYTGGKPLLSRCDYLANSHAKHFETLLFLPEFCKPPVQFTVYKKAPTTSRHD